MTSSSSFDDLADVYDAFRIGYASEVYDAIVAYGMHAGSRVLDIGAGTGIVSRALVDRGNLVTGIDLSAPMLTRARARVPEATFTVGAAEALPFADGSFDAVVSAQAFHWFDRTRALAEAMRVVRPGGVVAIWWKELMRGDTIRLLRDEVANVLGVDNPRPILSDGFDEFEASALVDGRLRVIPWLVTMTVSRYLGYERSRARARSAYGQRLDDYLAALGARLGAPATTISLSYLHLVYLGRVVERAS